jgi:hypothetical protein
MKVLVACEYSGVVRNAFIAKGHHAVSCDFEPSESPEIGEHYQGDVFDIINDGWDLMIAHPPCTYLSNAGARWLYPKGQLNVERYEKGLEAKEFFFSLLNANIDKICVENPKPSLIYELPTPTQVIHPYYFGDPYSKRTQLWLKNLSPLQHTNVVEVEGYWCGSYTSRFKGDKRKTVLGKTWKDRSRTFQGIANAMAEQWG